MREDLLCHAALIIMQEVRVRSLAPASHRARGVIPGRAISFNVSDYCVKWHVPLSK